MNIKEYLDELYYRFNSDEFIADDPISVPHRYSTPEDIEISAFMAATIAWGNRKMIVRNATRMANLMGNEPYNYILNAAPADLRELDGFVHRTFNHTDLQYFVLALRNIYTNHGGLGGFFRAKYLEFNDLRIALSDFRKVFFELASNPTSEFTKSPRAQAPAGARTTRHLSNIDKGAACKRLCMFLKWMVRRDAVGVDFGIWSDAIPASALYLPLDVHCGNTSRSLGLLQRKQNDWRAVEEVTAALRALDSADPVKYDFALFCAGIQGIIK